MLRLKGITKDYLSGDAKVQALKGVDIVFRQNEFVAVLGPSGCGKTTLLNIIGGLDRYSDGDLFIAGKSTKQYKARDWDYYRNHTIGFVFQTYNLIPHQTVLANVELALTLSGISKAARRERAKKMLEKVGLGDQIYKRPNQMSGGQMQRVAIARALINDPEILLADEPTGALDTETSVQIMDLLKEIAKDRLVIMVTHNPELAEQYATRTIRLLDGKVQNDTKPYTVEEEEKALKKAAKKAEKESGKKKRVSMSFATATSLSLKNLMTKKARTILTTFAGSIGIIGISLILSLSDGFQTYINKVQEDTLSSYPLTIQSQSADLSGMVESITGQAEHKEEHALDQVYVSSTATQMMNAMVAEVQQNDMVTFKKYLEEHKDELTDYNIAYQYNLIPQIYLENTADSDKVTAVNPNPLVDAYYNMLGYDMNNLSSSFSQMMSMGTSTMDIWTLLYGDQALLDAQYDVIAGKWATGKDEVVLVVDQYNEINELTMYGLGLRDAAEISKLFEQIMKGEELEAKDENFSYDDIMKMTFKLIPNTARYEYDSIQKCYVDRSRSNDFMKARVDEGLDLRISGIVRKKAGVQSGALRAGTICYTSALVDYLIEENGKAEIVKAQLADKKIDVFTGYEFEDIDEVTIDDVYKYIDNLSEAELKRLQAMFQQMNGSSFTGADIAAALKGMSDEQLVAAIKPKMLADATVEDAKGFAQTDMGKAALTAAAAQSLGVQPDPAILTRLSDEQLLALYKGVLDQSLTAEAIRAQISNMTEEEQNALAAAFNPAQDIETLKAAVASMDEKMLLRIFKEQVLSQSTSNTYEGNLEKLGQRDIDNPFAIYIYSSSFEAKEKFEDFMTAYNDKQTAAGNEDGVIEYTDYIGILLSSVTKIINMVSYVLIGFVSISLVVSSIMIGIITYISVLERTKEIGILRSIGASKRDVSHVFNAETFLVGLTSGLLGVIITMLLDIPVNMIIEYASGVPNVAFLRPVYALILVGISIVLTLISGIIPSQIAAKKDPATALRTE